jgi:hypothetical protein
LSINARVECPQCHRVHVLAFPTNETECNCHLICEDGDEPDDCSVTPYNFSGQLGYPMGAETSNEDKGDDRMHATGYCSIHNKYVYKQMQIIEVNWKEYLSRRIRPGSRTSDWKKG